MYRAVLLTTLFTLAAAQYFYPISDDEGNYVELIRIPRALRNQPSLIPSSPLPPRVGAPGGIPLPAIHSNRNGPPMMGYEQRNGPPMIGYEPVASGSKKEPLIMAESGGHGHGHGHDYVDYGAYTGGWGAFGWYTDHPVHSYGH